MTYGGAMMVAAIGIGASSAGIDWLNVACGVTAIVLGVVMFVAILVDVTR